MDYEMSPQPLKGHCINEARISKIEAHLDNKKEDIDSITGDYYHLRDKLDIISMNVTELTAILKENQKRREEADQKIEELQIQLTQLSSTMNTLKWLLGLGLPVACSIISMAITIYG